MRPILCFEHWQIVLQFKLSVFITSVRDTLGVFRLNLFFISGKVALEPFRFAITFKYQQVSAYTVEEKTVMADHHCAALKIYYRLLEDAHGIDIKVIRRFVKKQKVAAAS